MSNHPPEHDIRTARDIQALREWDADAPPVTDRARGRARARLFAAMAPDGRAADARAPLFRRPALRLVLATTVAAAATVAVAAAGVLVAVNRDSSDTPDRAGGATSSPRLADVSAQTVLRKAAVEDRKHAKTVAPRDDQFLYTKEIIKETSQETGRTKSYTDENWQSVDGTRRSWTMEIGHGWWSEPTKGEGISWPPTDWTELKKLPTDDPDKLLIAVRDWGMPHHNRPIAKDEWPDVEFSLTGLLSRVPVMPDGLRPAAFEALAKIPGIKATEGEKDAKGRVGIAISYDVPEALNSDASFLFDADTYAYLGMRDVRTANDGSRHYVQRSYLDSYAVTDKVKQRP